MIPKSLSRKSPSFSQLIAYMNSEKADERFDLHQHCFARRDDALAREFYDNSQLLGRRKNGNYLYHEILSITIEDGVDREHAKACLRELALKYMEDRCPTNMVYGCLHDDHRDHVHYHLMISANERGGTNRHRLTKGRFDQIKRDLETHTLEKYPELKQRKVITAEREEKKLSRKASELKRQSKKLERYDFVRTTIFQTMAEAQSLESFKERLADKNFAYYRRGKHHGVEVTHPDGRVEKYRFATLGVAQEYELYQETLRRLSEAERVVEEPEPAKSRKQASEREFEPSEGRSAGRERDLSGLNEKRQEERVAETAPDPVKTSEQGREKDMAKEVEQDREKGFAESVGEMPRETARHVAHEIEEVGKLVRGAVTPGEEKLGQTLKDRDREDLEDHMRDIQQAKWREEIAQKRAKQKSGPDLER